MSVNRKKHIDEARLREQIETKIAKDKEENKKSDGFYKVIVAKCGDIRQIVGEDARRYFSVYDTAKSNDKSHADICQAVDPPPGTPNRTSTRNAIGSTLRKAFSAEATDLAAVFGEE